MMELTSRAEIGLVDVSTNQTQDRKDQKRAIELHEQPALYRRISQASAELEEERTSRGLSKGIP